MVWLGPRQRRWRWCRPLQALRLDTHSAAQLREPPYLHDELMDKEGNLEREGRGGGRCVVANSLIYSQSRGGSGSAAVALFEERRSVPLLLNAARQRSRGEN